MSIGTFSILSVSDYLEVSGFTSITGPVDFSSADVFGLPAAEQGATGPQGPQGLMGISGPQGLTGATGAQGPKGEDGIDGIARYEFTALEGASTTIIQTNVPTEGPQGPIGATGAMGLQGAPGSQGAQGPEGPMGPMGPQGPAGPQGLPGESYEGPKQFAYACLADGTELYNRGFQQVGVSSITGRYEYQFAEPLENAQYAVVATLRNGQTNNHANVTEINKFGFVLRIGKSASKPNNAPHSVIVMAN